MQLGSETRPGPHDKAISLGRGAYVYCVADSPEKTRLGEIGIGRGEVYTIPYRDLCAVVHSCAASLSSSDDREGVETWVVAHHRVVDAAWERWSTVLPMTFGTVIKGEPGTEAERNTEAWLKQEYEVLKGRMEVVRGKAEYGVQVFWDPK
ncbi:MAG: GvpL/GvpF family gas vesicle protein, partial [Chloroflexota bacterium]|nr:GvpL/GvpF family gas vesicle protein [Chloroflexota bacterium]